MNETDMRDLVAHFKKNYKAQDTDAIWRQQSATFRSFWSEKVLAHGTGKISNSDCDTVIKILDRHGKGNTKQSEVVARTMVTQDKWRELFNSLHIDQQLASLLDSVLKETDLEQKANLINDLYEANKGKKNYLTGGTATTINALLAAYDPFTNLSSVSLKHRKLQLDFLQLQLPFDWEQAFPGQRIVRSNLLLCEATRRLGLDGNALTLGKFWYSQPVKDLWMRQSIVKKSNRLGENSGGRLDRFVVGRIYSRRNDIQKPFGGKHQGGVFIPDDSPTIFLFTEQGGENSGNHDGWDENGSFRFFSNSQEGDMLRAHLDEGRDLYLFQSLGKSKDVLFLGMFQCAGYEEQNTPDNKEAQRKAIIFFLAPVGDTKFESTESETPPKSANITELRNKAYEAAKTSGKTTSKAATVNFRMRSAAVRKYVLARAEGNCECCKTKAPFTRTNGTPYLEPHHTHRLADGGPDNPAWVAAVCPNCHREIHHGVDGKKLNQEVRLYVETFEKEMKAPPTEPLSLPSANRL